MKINIFWFRRDLRLHDNQALFHALKAGNVLPIFIFDPAILNQLPDKDDARVTYIHQQLEKINAQLTTYNSSIKVFFPPVLEAFKTLTKEYPIKGVFFNEDYEPYATQRDSSIIKWLEENNISAHSFQDQVIFHPKQITKADGLPYTVYTSYSKKWKEHFASLPISNYPSETLLQNIIQHNVILPSLAEIGFKKALYNVPSYSITPELLHKYAENRDFPFKNKTSHLGTYLRFGTVSIREIVTAILPHSSIFLNELIWREFFCQILYHFPHVAKHPFKPIYNNVAWRNNEAEFEAWKKGNTGYPIVDAGMRQLNQTGLMHNRVRMICASFLCKHLLIDWRWGETYFAQKLLDFDLASNNGNWQWASGTGCDAAPYFRVFNPYLQTQKFDPNHQYIQQYVPEWQELTYSQPIVNHDFARKRAIETYKKIF